MSEITKKEIRSNTLNKLKKIKNGNVFDNPLIFLRELLQNSQRAKAKNVDVLLDNGKLVCHDDGCGCKDADNILTLDLSSWESTKEGYGIGFWSCLYIPELKEIIISSRNWKVRIDIVKLFDTGDLTVSAERIERQEGFTVELVSPFFKEDSADEIESFLYDVCKYMPYKTKLNGLLLPQENYFDEFCPTNFWKMYKNKYFVAKLSISKCYMPSISLFYDCRFVTRQCWEMASYVDGVIEANEGYITLKEPDRVQYTKDEKFSRFVGKLEECIKDLFKSYIEENGIEDECPYDEAISTYLNVSEYEKFLTIGNIEKVEFKKSKGGTVVEEYEDVDKSERKDINFRNSDFFTYTEKDSVTVQRVSTLLPSAKTKKIKEVKKAPIKDKVKQLRKCLWVLSNDVFAWQEIIQKIKYKGIEVITVPNRLYKNVMEKYGVLHISEFENAFVEKFERNNVGCKNEKEKIFLRLLSPIAEKYNLPADVFQLADITITSSMVVNDETVMTKKQCNKKGAIVIFGITNGEKIYLDRRAMELSQFNLKKDGFGINELKAMVKNSNTIAHELSHYLFHTVDNTEAHFLHERDLQQEIIELYLYAV